MSSVLFSGTLIDREWGGFVTCLFCPHRGHRFTVFRYVEWYSLGVFQPVYCATYACARGGGEGSVMCSIVGSRILRDHHGCWLSDFPCSVSDVNPLRAELLATDEGLRHAWDLSMRRLLASVIVWGFGGSYLRCWHLKSLAKGYYFSKLDYSKGDDDTYSTQNIHLLGGTTATIP